MATASGIASLVGAAAPHVIEFITEGVKAWRKSGKKSIMGGNPMPSLPKQLENPSRLGTGSVVYPVIVYLDLPITPAVLSVPLVAGAIAAVTSINPRAFVINWATRFQVVFQEYCLVGTRLAIRNDTRGSGAVDGGVTAFYLDESTNAAPTVNATLAHPRIELINAGVEGGSRQFATMAWVPRNYTELSWLSTAVDTTDVYFKVFSNLANFGTPAADTQVWRVTGTLRVAFRGLLA